MGWPVHRQRIYIAGPYRPTSDQLKAQIAIPQTIITKNIERARQRAIAIHRLGHFAYCPHTHTAHFDQYARDIPGQHWLDLGLDMLKHCEAVALVEGWEQSYGTLAELRYAEFACMHIYQPDELPEQVRKLEEINGRN